MSADKSIKMDGEVLLRPYAEGSKSERAAIILKTDQGEFVVRRRDGNPFKDPVLEGLVGQRITCEGVLHGHTFIINRWTTAKG